MSSTARIVVGTDGSPDSAIAIRYALYEAARRALPLQVVAVVVAPDYWTEALIVARGLPDVPDMRDTARSTARTQIDEAVAADPELGSVDVVVDAIAHPGPTGRALMDAAEGAELLVLGHRGRGAIGSAVLGSVGLYCVLHATGPVTIVPAAWKPAPAVPAAAAVS